MPYIKKFALMNTLSQFAQKRVDVIAQDQETKDYLISLKEGYVFNGRYIQGEIRGYGIIKCRTVAEVKKSVKRNAIQEGMSFTKDQKDLESEYLEIIQKEERSTIKALKKATEHLQSEEYQKQCQTIFDEILKKSEKKMASQEWQEEIKKKAWANVLKELNATTQYLGKEETYKRYFSVTKDEEFEKRSRQAQKILNEQERSKRSLVNWIIPYTLNSKDGFLIQLNKGIENPLFIQNAKELKVTLGRII